MSDIEAVEDQIDVIDLEHYACAGKPIPKHVTYYLIKVDDEKIRVKSPITATKILVAADLDPCDYRVEQKFRGGRKVELEPDHLVDLREPGVECFLTILTRTTVVIVNGREKSVEAKKLSFAELIELAFDDPPTGPNICFTVSYRNGPKHNPEGTLDEGGNVKIKRGMVFNVTPTDKS